MKPNWTLVRQQFPMLKQNLVYLDNAALVQKPQIVIDGIVDFYTKHAVSNRTSDTVLGIATEQIVLQTRQKLAQLLNVDWTEVFFNSGTTEGLNYSAQLLAQFVNPGDQILVSPYNHTSHIVPWVELAKLKKAKVVFSENFLKDLNEKTKIICYTQINNNFNHSVDLATLRIKALEVGALIVNDAAQAISHEIVDGQLADIIAFSVNKFFGPTGLGVLYVNQKLLAQMQPKKYGGGSIQSLAKDGSWTVNSQYFSQHEPGTLNLAGIFGLNKALDFFMSFSIKAIQDYLFELSTYAYDQLKQLEQVKIHSKRGDFIVLFEIKNIPSQDVSSYLGHRNIYIRSGWFCAKYLEHLIDKPLLRVSFQIYNNKSDIDQLCDHLKNGGHFIDV